MSSATPSSKTPPTPYLTNKSLRRAIRDADHGTLWTSCNLLAERVSRTYQRDREDMVSASTIKLFAVASSGKVDLGKNPFAYLTRVAMNECNRVVSQAKRHACASLDRDVFPGRDAGDAARQHPDFISRRAR